MKNLLTIILLFQCSQAYVGHACFWDRDTLAQEKRVAPTTLQVIAGHFPRHTDLVYSYRAKQRPIQLREAGWSWVLSGEGEVPTQLSTQALGWVDDLVVALDKLKRGQEGIEILNRVVTLHPDRYETQANLGTLLVHQHHWKEGLVALRKAIAINPQAHFGRERIQIALVEYLSERPSRRYPLDQTCVDPRMPFYKDPWITEKEGVNWRGLIARSTSRHPAHIKPSSKSLCMAFPGVYRPRGKKIERCKDDFCGKLKSLGISPEEGIKGVLGMMRFSNYQHPILLETLGHLLLSIGHRRPNRLAAMAFLQASRSPLLRSDSSKKAYESLAALSIVGHRFGLTQLDQTLSKEVKRGARLMKKIARDEEKWLKRGEAYLERRYQRRYLK